MAQKSENKKIEKVLGISVIVLLGMFSFSQAEAATQIFRSVGPGNTSALASGSGNSLSISESTAVFSSALPANVGVGDVIQYDASGDGTVDALAFIHGRTSATQYLVKNVSGETPTAVSGDNDWSVFRAYTSLYDAEEGTENSGIDASLQNFDSWTDGNNLVSNDLQWNIACYADGEDTTMGIVIQEWTTSNDNFLKIYTPYLSSEVGQSQRHQGVWDETKYRLVVSDDFPDGPPISVNTGSSSSSVNVWIDGLQVFTASMIMNTYGIELYNVTGEAKVSNSIIKTDPFAVSNYGIRIYNLTHTGTYKLWNNVIYSFFDGGIRLSGEENTLYAYNNTVIGNGTDGNCYEVSSGNFVSKNNLAQSCSAGFSGSFAPSSNYNLSDFADAPGANSANEETIGFLNPAGENYSLAPSDTAAIDAGTNLSSDANLSFLDDISGQRRYGTWDIGAREFIPSSIPGDLDEDGDVDIFDYNLFLPEFGKTGVCGNVADINGDCSVNIFDYNILVTHFGQRL